MWARRHLTTSRISAPATYTYIRKMCATITIIKKQGYRRSSPPGMIADFRAGLNPASAYIICSPKAAGQKTTPYRSSSLARQREIAAQAAEAGAHFFCIDETFASARPVLREIANALVSSPGNRSESSTSIRFAATVSSPSTKRLSSVSSSKVVASNFEASLSDAASAPGGGFADGPANGRCIVGGACVRRRGHVRRPDTLARNAPPVFTGGGRALQRSCSNALV
ncbi:hypothetical protein EDC40_101327 [Aminobacter aminovorans]|uniref:Uncharacterized protein n=1 Tax=Aminobacter aminovorans TaxID=83263 RepID=A0A380WPF5_AMIAI|nr:hypothetical protein EDC40_101327 [Aminobacter aminovorans]SUU90859.1 Uncharacterised protein [Aminobacter aminovorans]